MSHLQRVTTPPSPDILRKEEAAEEMTIRGITWTGWRPIDENDNRYFERAVYPSGKVVWYELVD